MTEFYCTTCRLYKPIKEKDLTRVKPVRCIGCSDRAKARVHAVKTQKATFDKYTPVVSDNS